MIYLVEDDGNIREFVLYALTQRYGGLTARSVERSAAELCCGLTSG